MQRFYEFGSFRIDPTKRLLLRDDQVVPLKPKAFETLLLLVQNSDRVLEKDELMKALWPNSFVEEANLTQHISILRKALGESPTDHRYIVTAPGRGYRFVADVREVGDNGGEHPKASPVTSFSIEQTEPGGAQQAFQQQPLGVSGGVKKDIKGWPARTLLAASLIILTVALAYIWIAGRSKDTNVGSTVRSIAVLPFKTLGVEEDEEYLGLGISDALINRLGNLRQVVVRPTSAVRKYTGQEPDLLVTGRELSVDAVLDGNIQRAGDRIRVTAQLVSMRNNVPLWSETFDEKFTDLFTVQDRISERVVQALTLTLTGDERKLLSKHPTSNTEAYQAYLKGRYFWNKRTEEGYKRAIEYFELAIEKDAQYAQPYAGLADSYILVGVASGQPWKEMLRKAEAAALKALEIDDTLAETHTSLAMIKAGYGQDVHSEREFKRAIELNPSYSTAHHWYSLFLAGRGRFDEGLREIKRAQELDPLSLIINADVAWVFYFARQYDRVIEHCQKTLEIDPDFVQAHFNLGVAYEGQAMYTQAIRALETALKLSKDDPGYLGELGRIYALSGNKGEALKILTELRKLSKRRHVKPQSIAMVYIGLKEKDAAFEWLEKAYEERDGWVTSLRVDPRVDSLRGDPRFADLMRRVGSGQ